jgi:hypothetical protein
MYQHFVAGLHRDAIVEFDMGGEIIECVDHVNGAHHLFTGL